MANLSPAQLELRGRAAMLLALAAIAVRLLPFRFLMRSAEWGKAIRKRHHSHLRLAVEMAQAVSSASRRVPWRTVCIQEALALHWMLRSRALPSTLHFGVRPAKDRPSAHVWVSFDGMILIGEQAARDHVELVRFPGYAGIASLPNAHPLESPS